jgi:hypothetical protein
MTANPTVDQVSAESRERIRSQIKTAAEAARESGATDFQSVFEGMYLATTIGVLMNPNGIVPALTAALSELVMRELDADLPSTEA